MCVCVCVVVKCLRINPKLPGGVSAAAIVSVCNSRHSPAVFSQHIGVNMCMCALVYVCA